MQGIGLPFMRMRKREMLGRIAVLATVLSFGTSAQHVSAQYAPPQRIPTALPVSTSSGMRVPTTETDSRAQLYDSLNDEVAGMERQFGVLRRVIKLVSPTVVHIEAIKDSASEGNLTSSGKAESKRIEEDGAGVIVEFGGKHYVITNRHVIHSAKLESIRVHFSDRTIVHPLRVWSDPSTDIAVMAIQSRSAIPARIADSSDVEIGDFVLAVGSPFGLAHSVTYGIISAKGRRNLELGNKAIEIQDFFQTDAAINPGNSGGPLMNLRGEVIGINTAIASNSGGNEGIGFSIPINLAASVAKQLIDQGQLTRGYLGVQMENAFDIPMARRLGLEHPMGALVKAVKVGSPAEKAGLRVGDIILEFDGVHIENDGHLVQTVGLTPAGRDAVVLFIRDGKKLEKKVVLTELPNQN